ncbi:MAG: PadR family transcriptional regulator [Candidatus Hermodarchaeota archaeon]
MRIPNELTQGEVAILSLLTEGETHGYALNEAIEDRGFRNWADIGFSSIYAILNRLEKKKLITSRLNPSEKGPAKKLYKLTRKGKTTLLNAIKLYISEPDRPRSRVDLGAAYITLLPPREAIQCLEHYQTQLQDRLTHLKQIRKAQQPLPFGAEIIFDHGFVKGRAELKWVEKVLRQLKHLQEPATNE